MNDLSWKIQDVLADMIEEVEKKYDNEVDISPMDFYGEEFDTSLFYDKGCDFNGEKLDRIYIKYKGETVYLDKVGDMYELDGLFPVTHIEVISGALTIVIKYLNKIEKVLKGRVTMNKVNMDGIPLRVLAEVNSSINNMAKIGICAADVHVPNQYLVKVVKALKILGYEVKNLGSNTNTDTTKLCIDFNEPRNVNGDYNLDCTVYIDTAQNANDYAKEHKKKMIRLLRIIMRTKRMKEKGCTLKEYVDDVANILHETELWYLEHYHNIYAHAVDGGDTVIFELKDGEDE